MPVALAALLVALAFLLFRQRKRKRFPFGPPANQAQIEIGEKKGTDCGVTLSPEKITGKRGGGVVWWVTNTNCSGQREVRVANFRKKATGQSNDPLTDDTPGRRVPVGPGQTRPIRAGVKPNADQDLYLYDILIDGNPAQDPELEIVP